MISTLIHNVLSFVGFGGCNVEIRDELGPLQLEFSRTENGIGPDRGRWQRVTLEIRPDMENLPIDASSIATAPLRCLMKFREGKPDGERSFLSRVSYKDYLITNDQDLNEVVQVVVMWLLDKKLPEGVR